MVPPCAWRHPSLLLFTRLPSRLFSQLFSSHDAPWLFVGLGNPGKKFEGTRHNIGFEMIDAVSHAEGITLTTFRHESLLGEGMISGARVLLAKPQTYANLSGESVEALAQHYGVPVQQIVVIFDDMLLNVSKLWLLPKGGHGNHKGLMSLIKHLKGSCNFPRLRIGIGSPPGTMDPKAYVLQKFCKEEREMMDTAIACGVEVMRLVATSGVEIASNCISRLRKSYREGKENRELLKE